MRMIAGILLFALTGPLFARTPPADDMDPWKAHIGLMAGMNVSLMQFRGGFGPYESTQSLWTAAFGLYYKSNVKNMFRLEAQTGYEVAGLNREVFYQRNGTNDYVRIFDRYRTIPLTLLLTRNFGWQETVSMGIGFKNSFVVNYSTRHVSNSNPPGLILTPEVLKWYGSPLVQLSANLQFAEIAFCGWYAITPVIDQYSVVASPFGVSFLVKARLFQL